MLQLPKDSACTLIVFFFFNSEINKLEVSQTFVAVNLLCAIN